MFFVVLSILVTICLYVFLGITTEYEERKDDWGRVKTIAVRGWKFQLKQIFAVFGLLICVMGFITKVPANHVGIVYSPFGGTKSDTLSEGFATKNPLDKIYKISTEVQTKVVENLTTQTKDAQYVTSVLDIKYKVNASNAYIVFKQYRTLDKVSKDLIVPTSQRVLEHVTTTYNVIDILGEKRNEIYKELEVKLAEEFALYGVDFVSITINDMDAGESLENAITAEAVAKKEVETAEQMLLKTQTEAKQKSVQAQAEQDAAKIQAETKLIEAEAEKKANELLKQTLSDEILRMEFIEKWNGKLPEYMGGEIGLMLGVGNDAN